MMTPSYNKLIFPMTENLAGFLAHVNITLVSTKSKIILD
jgi:hypothetical protein